MVVDNTDRLVWDFCTQMPYVSKFVAIVSVLMNLLLPGFGTCIAACAAGDAVVSKT